MGHVRRFCRLRWRTVPLRESDLGISNVPTETWEVCLLEVPLKAECQDRVYDP